MKKFVLVGLMSFGLATASAAATLNEFANAGGFGSTEATATTVALTTEVLDINGTLGAGDVDFLRLTGLTAGARTVTLSFGLSLPNPNAAGSGGGTVTISPVGSPALQTFNLQKGGGRNGALSGTTSLSFSLDDTFAGGDLLFGLAQASGNRTVTYAMSIPGNIINPPPAPVPLPPAGLLLFAAVGGIVIWRRRRRVDLHQHRTQAT